ncbi:hypothetical protein NHP21011_04430 [Helicobacter heilmannii]|uniref:hypothetical protein n=1 Tax=Helicobacter heilmannii TaxID=35817 RepID=UPI00244D8141|nr:hypothetical protein [Helicobacter heilmannii]GMB94351.1 hypothetical protein NHP21011_04430 [Helicobacter heilmannii]
MDKAQVYKQLSARKAAVSVMMDRVFALFNAPNFVECSASAPLDFKDDNVRSYFSALDRSTATALVYCALPDSVPQSPQGQALSLSDLFSPILQTLAICYDYSNSQNKPGFARPYNYTPHPIFNSVFAYMAHLFSLHKADLDTLAHPPAQGVDTQDKLDSFNHLKERLDPPFMQFVSAHPVSRLDLAKVFALQLLNCANESNPPQTPTGDLSLNADLVLILAEKLDPSKSGALLKDYYAHNDGVASLPLSVACYFQNTIKNAPPIVDNYTLPAEFNDLFGEQKPTDEQICTYLKGFREFVINTDYTEYTL